MANKIIRLVTVATDGSFREREFDDFDEISKMHEQIGIDDCSTDLSLRGFPIFRGLIGPIPESKKVARYESPEVFEVLTKQWTKAKAKRRRRRSSEEVQREREELARQKAGVPAPMALPITNNTFTSTPSNFV